MFVLLMQFLNNVSKIPHESFFKLSRNGIQVSESLQYYGYIYGLSPC